MECEGHHDENPYRSPEHVDRNSDGRPRREERPGKASNLPLIAGVGTGAIGGVVLGIAFYDEFPTGVFLFPLPGALVAGALVGMVVRLLGGSPAASRGRRDRFRLALTSLGLGPLVAAIPGLLLGGSFASPFFLGCMVLGLAVGLAMFAGLALSAVFAGSRHRR